MEDASLDAKEAIIRARLWLAILLWRPLLTPVSTGELEKAGGARNFIIANANNEKATLAGIRAWTTPRNCARPEAR
jgi:hypothetical protein